MENAVAEKDTTVATLTSEVKVLRTGGPRWRHKKREVKFDRHQFFVDCKSHFSLLLMDTRTPPKTDHSWDMLDYVIKRRIAEDKQPIRYQFDCYRAGSYSSGGYGQYGQVINGNALIHEIRKRLKDENWISKNVLELPPKQTPNRWHYSSKDRHIDDVFSACLKDEHIKIFQYLLHLHREQVR